MLTLLARIFASSLFKTAEGGIKAGWQWVFSSATHVLEAALLLACLFGLYEHHQLNKTRDDLAACRTGRAADRKTWNERVAAAQAEAKRQQGLFTGASKDAQTYHDQLAQANQSLLDYKRTHRLPQGTAGSLPASTPGAGGDPAIHGEAPGAALLAITEADIDACDADYRYAASAYHFSQTLIQQGQAVLQTSGATP